jgi:hypothetical protein
VLLLNVIAEKLNPDTHIFELVATEAMFALVAAEEGLPGRSGNFGLVPTKVEFWGVPYGLNPQEELIAEFTDEKALQAARNAIRLELERLSRLIYGDRAPSEDLGVSRAIEITKAKAAKAKVPEDLSASHTEAAEANVAARASKRGKP